MLKIIYVADAVQLKIMQKVLLPAFNNPTFASAIGIDLSFWNSVTVQISPKVVGTFGFQLIKPINFIAPAIFKHLDKVLRTEFANDKINVTNLKRELKILSKILVCQVVSPVAPVLYVANSMQKALLEKVLIPQMASGFWKNFRPANNHIAWRHVVVDVALGDSALGACGWIVPRNYDFANPKFLNANERAVMAVATAITPGITLKKVKHELLGLSRIVGGRLCSTNGKVIKLNRGGKNTVTARKKAINTVTRKVPVIFAKL